jgi:hypothetical protein
LRKEKAPVQVRAVSLFADDLRRANVLAAREGVTASTVIRVLLEKAFADYEKEHGAIPIEGVDTFSWLRRPVKKAA